MRNYRVTLTGKSDLLHHSDNIEWQDRLVGWREDSAKKKKSKAGDDRSPGFTWIGNMYHNDEFVTIPSENISRCLMQGGTQVLVPGGKGGKTFKSQTRSGMVVNEEQWPLLVSGKPIPVKEILALHEEEDFNKHVEKAKSLRFSLYVKRAAIGNNKHVRVRPRFSNWSATGTISVWDDQLTIKALKDIVKIAGDYKGLGDWRPSSKTPGPFGRFAGVIEEVIE